MRTNIHLSLCFVLVIGLGSAVYGQYKKITALETRIAVLETVREKEKPETAWLIQAATDLFTWAFNDYNSRIERNQQRYLSKTGFEAYQKVLSQLELTEKLRGGQWVVTPNVSMPKFARLIEYEISKYPDVTDCCSIYQIPVELIFRRTTAGQLPKNLLLEIELGRVSHMDERYPDPEYRWFIPDHRLIITDIKLQDTP